MKKLYIYIFIFLFIILGVSSIMKKEPNLRPFSVLSNWIENYPEQSVEVVYNDFIDIQDQMDNIDEKNFSEEPVDVLFSFWFLTRDFVLTLFDLIKFFIQNIIWVLSIFKYFLI